MKFVNLNKLKIDKNYQYQTYSYNVHLNPQDSIFELKTKIREIITTESFFIESSLPINYEFIIHTSGSIELTDQADSFFITTVNIISAIFFECFCINKGRPRERRLDVPDTLKLLAGNMSLIKRAINSQTKNDLFNITVAWDNLDMYWNYSLTPDNHVKEGRDDGIYITTKEEE